MTDVLKHEPGTFCWADLATTDQKAATKFYTSLFGWEVKEFPIGEEETYTMFFVNGKEVCALHSMMTDQRKQGIPPNWLAYVSVEDANETIKKIPEIGTFAVLLDPQGAAFAVMQGEM